MWKKRIIFAVDKNNYFLEDIDMLGVNSPREPITPEFSRKIREALWRATTGNLTPEEKDAIRRGREARKKVKIVWK